MDPFEWFDPEEGRAGSALTRAHVLCAMRFGQLFERHGRPAALWFKAQMRDRYHRERITQLSTWQATELTGIILAAGKQRAL